MLFRYRNSALMAVAMLTLTCPAQEEQKMVDQVVSAKIDTEQPPFDFARGVLLIAGVAALGFTYQSAWKNRRQ